MDSAREHIAFTETIKKLQERKGSRNLYAKHNERAPLMTEINEELAEFLSGLRSIYLATASADGQPYVQHRGGPPGFLQVIDIKTIAFADFTGNRQYVSQGNLLENPKAFLFLMDYRSRRRIKVWGRAEVREDQPDLLAEAMKTLGSYKARPEQMMYFHVEAWEMNCKRHIPVRYEAEEVEALVAERDSRISALIRQLEELKRGS